MKTPQSFIFMCTEEIKLKKKNKTVIVPELEK